MIVREDSVIVGRQIAQRPEKRRIQPSKTASKNSKQRGPSLEFRSRRARGCSYDASSDPFIDRDGGPVRGCRKLLALGPCMTLDQRAKPETDKPG